MWCMCWNNIPVSHYLSFPRTPLFWLFFICPPVSPLRCLKWIDLTQYLINISCWFFFLWSKASGVVWLLLLLPGSAKTVKVNSSRLLKLFFALILCASKPEPVEQEWLLCLLSHHQAHDGWYQEYSQHDYIVFWWKHNHNCQSLCHSNLFHIQPYSIWLTIQMQENDW